MVDASGRGQVEVIDTRRTNPVHVSIDVERHGPDVTVRLAGDLDTWTADAVARLLGSDTGEADRAIVVDLSGVSSYDAGALVALLHLRHALDERAVPMTIQSPPSSVLRLAPLAGLDGMCGQPPGGVFDA